jgi:hypothetical protein
VTGGRLELSVTLGGRAIEARQTPLLRACDVGLFCKNAKESLSTNNLVAVHFRLAKMMNYLAQRFLVFARWNRLRHWINIA